MDNISEIVKDVIRKISLRKPDIQFQLEEVWREITDEKQRKHIRLIGVKNGKVSVYVDSPAWAHQMRIKKSTILKKLKKKIPEVTDINFRVGNT